METDIRLVPGGLEVAGDAQTGCRLSHAQFLDGGGQGCEQIAKGVQVLPQRRALVEAARELPPV
jgi:hypothetical protein